MTALTYAQLEGVWIAAGGDPSAAETMAAIAYPESGANPNAVQQGQPYATTGWGLWQITPGNSDPSIGTNQQLLDPFTNAKVAVAKYNASKARSGNGFLPWTTYTSGKYQRYLQAGVAPSTAGLNTNGATLSASIDTLAPGSSTTDTGSTSSSDPTCLVGWSGVSVPIVGSVGSFCLITKKEMRATIGGILILSAGVVALLATITLVKGIDLPKTAAPGPAVIEKIPTPATPTTTDTASSKPTTPSQPKVVRRQANVTPGRKGKPAPKAARVVARAALTAPVVAA